MNTKLKEYLDSKTDEEILNFLFKKYINPAYIDVYNITQSIKDENIQFNFIKHLMNTMLYANQKVYKYL